MRRSSTIRASMSMIRACVVTSRAVVGSSAISTSGFAQIAIAIITRCRIPPENSWGSLSARRSGWGMPDVAEHARRRAARASRRPTRSCVRIASTTWCPTVCSGLSDDIGSW